MKKYINILFITLVFTFLSVCSILLDDSLRLFGDNTIQILFRFAIVCFTLFFFKDKKLFDTSSKGKIIILIMSIIPIGLVIFLQNKYVTNISITSILLDLLTAISEELIFRYVYVTVFKSNNALTIKNIAFVVLQNIAYSIIITVFISKVEVTSVLLSIVTSIALVFLYIKNDSIIENAFLNFLLRYLL